MLRRALPGVALLVVVATAAGSSSAAFPGRNGLIAFSYAGVSGGYRIVTMRPGGTHRRALTPSTSKAGNYDPAFSPNGRRIVFVHVGKQSDLWTMNANGSHRRRLTSTSQVSELQPSWSPDGTQVVFAVEKPAALKGIWVVGVDGHGRVQLTNGVDSTPSWSPDGSKIAFTRSNPADQTSAIYVVPATGGTATDLTNDPNVSDFEPDWSPDGHRIVFTSDRANAFEIDLWVMNADGSGAHQISHTPYRDEYDPAWSPDGRRLVYDSAGKRGSSSFQIFVSRADGSHARVITHSQGGNAILNLEPNWQPLGG